MRKVIQVSVPGILDAGAGRKWSCQDDWYLLAQGRDIGSVTESWMNRGMPRTVPVTSGDKA